MSVCLTFLILNGVAEFPVPNTLITYVSEHIPEADHLDVVIIGDGGSSPGSWTTEDCLPVPCPNELGSALTLCTTTVLYTND